MSSLTLNKVEILVVDPNSNARRSVQDALQNYGYPEFDFAGSFREVRDKFRIREPDMIISETELPDGTLSEFVRRLRNDEISGNPFLPIIGISSDSSKEVMAELEASGVDAILSRPLSTTHLVKCITEVMNKKRQFLVTANYIGPVRPSAMPTDGIGAEPIDVPHTLKSKSKGIGYRSMFEDIANATKLINRLKMSRLSEKIVMLTNGIAEILEKHGFADEAHGLFEDILKASRDAGQRVAGTDYAHVTELCDSLIKLLNKICIEDQGAIKKDIKLLKPMASSIHLAFSESEEAAAFSRQVSNSVSNRNS
ncbi:MAG: response regulator [Rhodospirillaceae bacterium]|jgi:CheY-like chemotaxis protein|nr:response regulator [Rhodospirillales bacterium]MBT3907363.1 response regulator [Rhodospirillaceae bacterium]MBT4700224.1 response regulator [Rhodospirillaceae bacterium]MBT5035031.1 response regulator [Rhodospirillaceae bacterium]MBT6221808.1 response regulator [Rhodospirillaceae bacterium]